MADTQQPNGSATKHKKQDKVHVISSNWVYDIFLWTFSILVDLFFREVHPRGAWKVPRRGPLIFVAAPHANQVGNIRQKCPCMREY